jgi:hypothetical protein
VLVYDEASALAQGRKLCQPWLGPYCVEKRLSHVSYILRAENDASVARVHVNRMREGPRAAEENARKPKAGMWPDSRRTLRGILERREKEGAREYKARRARVQSQARGKARIRLGTGGGLPRGVHQGARVVEGTVKCNCGSRCCDAYSLRQGRYI